jgi:exodeoxyribonuclease VII large subunit
VLGWGRTTLGSHHAGVARRRRRSRQLASRSVEQVSFDLGTSGEPAEPTLSVLELTTSLRDAVRASFPAQVWVRGEVQNLRRSQNGHTYFALVEKGGRGDQVKARIDVALFRDDRGPVERALREVPGAAFEDDVEVRVRGRLEVYAPQGRVQLKMTAIDPVFTVGGIAAARARVLHELAADGLLERNRRLPLPLVPLRVGLVASAESAAYHDFVEELTESGFGFRVGVVDVRVQGANASRRIVYGLRQMALRDADVVVVIRGGGSRADLAPFDTDVVARAIAAMPVPVICGVGHEVDRSVADEVAHMSRKTPTACVQLLVSQVSAFTQRLDAASQRVVARARSRAAIARRSLDEAARHVRRGVPAVLARERALVDRRHGRVEELARLRVRDAGRNLEDCARRVGELGRGRLREAGLTLDASAATVRALDPVRVLERGYSITRTVDGRVVRVVDDMAVGDVLHTTVARGALVSRVESTSGAEPAVPSERGGHAMPVHDTADGEDDR